MNRYRQACRDPYSEESRRALSLAFPRTSADRLALLIFPSDQMGTVLEILEQTEVSWIKVTLDDPACPPQRSLERLGRTEELNCFVLSGRHALVEELLATLEYDSGLDWSLLDRLTWQLEERKVPFGIGLSLPSGSRSWLELTFSASGFWQSLHQLFGSSYTPGHPLLARSIFAISIGTLAPPVGEPVE